MIAFLHPAGFGGESEGKGNRGGADVAVGGVGEDALGEVDAEGFDQRLHVRGAHLMADVVADALLRPAVQLAGRDAPGLLGQDHAGLQQTRGVGDHPLGGAHAEPRIRGVGERHAAVHAMGGLGKGALGEDHGHRGRTESEGGEGFPEVTKSGVGMLKAGDGGFDHIARAFAVDDQGVVGDTGLDHPARDLDAIQEPETGVRQVEVAALLGEAKVAVHQTGHGGLEVVLRHRGADEDTDLARGDAGALDRAFGHVGRRLMHGQAAGPETALDDAGELQHGIDGDLEPAEHGVETAHQLLSGNRHGRKLVSDRFDREVVELHR